MLAFFNKAVLCKYTEQTNEQMSAPGEPKKTGRGGGGGGVMQTLTVDSRQLEPLLTGASRSFEPTSIFPGFLAYIYCNFTRSNLNPR